MTISSSKVQQEPGRQFDTQAPTARTNNADRKDAQSEPKKKKQRVTS